MHYLSQRLALAVSCWLLVGTGVTLVAIRSSRFAPVAAGTVRRDRLGQIQGFSDSRMRDSRLAMSDEGLRSVCAIGAAQSVGGVVLDEPAVDEWP